MGARSCSILSACLNLGVEPVRVCVTNITTRTTSVAQGAGGQSALGYASALQLGAKGASAAWNSLTVGRAVRSFESARVINTLSDSGASGRRSRNRGAGTLQTR